LRTPAFPILIPAVLECFPAFDKLVANTKLPKHTTSVRKLKGVVPIPDGVGMALRMQWPPLCTLGFYLKNQAAQRFAESFIFFAQSREF